MSRILALLSLVATALFCVPTADAIILDSLVYNGHRYYLISENSATGAAAEAQSIGGYLATINNEAEHDFLWDTWKGSLGTGLGLWIGLERTGWQQSTFAWMNGEPVIFTYWAPGEPNNGRGNYEEDYVNMDSRFSSNGMWNDVPNEGPNWKSARGIVEVNAPEVSTLVLLGSGFTAFVLRRRRQRQNKRKDNTSGVDA